jgi:PhnB protein
MAAIEPYINFAGRTAQAMEFYQGVFGGNLSQQLAKDGPMAAQTPPEHQNDVFHADLNAGNFHILGSDMMSTDTPPVNNVISLAVTCDSEEQLRAHFDKLVEGGSVVWPVRDSEWGSLYAQLVDKFGIQWMLNFDKSQAKE